VVDGKPRQGNAHHQSVGRQGCACETVEADMRREKAYVNEEQVGYEYRRRKASFFHDTIFFPAVGRCRAKRFLVNSGP
jgi:hypothetical protein